MTSPGDTDLFQEFAAANPEKMVEIAQIGKTAGAIHHRFAISDGHIVVFDEWDSAESFQGFFEGNEDIAEVMRGAGASGPPVVAFYEALSTADEF
jgi:heme-degrading monooxygenase HmoA